MDFPGKKMLNNLHVHPLTLMPHPVIPCLLSVCFDDAVHGKYASFLCKQRDKSKLLDFP